MREFAVTAGKLRQIRWWQGLGAGRDGCYKERRDQQGRLFAEKSRAEIDGQLAAVTAA